MFMQKWKENSSLGFQANCQNVIQKWKHILCKQYLNGCLRSFFGTVWIAYSQVIFRFSAKATCVENSSKRLLDRFGRCCSNRGTYVKFRKLFLIQIDRIVKQSLVTTFSPTGGIKLRRPGMLIKCEHLLSIYHSGWCLCKSKSGYPMGGQANYHKVL